ncbi:MAG: nitroreductase family protein [Acidimicrobiia bacterium]|nr:nitroreductase family protein [Acidimicrobiia bacterium]
MLSATELGLATCWVAAPIFCSEQARESLSLPETWTPQALILVGNPDAEYIPRERPEISLDEFRTFY